MDRRGRAVAAYALLCVVVTGCGTPTDSQDADDRRVPVVTAGTPDGTVPSVFAHTRESVGALLGNRQWDVRYDEQVSCDPEGRPIGTDPPAGTPLQPGDAVTVLLSYQAANTDCAADLSEPWQFVDFATGRGPAPRFADHVTLFVDGARTGTMPGADAARATWGADSALDILRRASDQVLRVGESYLMPQLQVAAGTPPDTWCGIARPRAVGDREALTLTLDFAEVTAGARCPARVAVYETAGAIDTVVAWSEGVRGSDTEPIPDVVGLPLTEAREAVTAAGYPTHVQEQETCHPRRGVVEQAPVARPGGEGPAAGWVGPVTLVVEVPHTVRSCAALDAAARGFVRFAQGGRPPAWAPEVHQLLGYAPWATVTASAADAPASWSLCPEGSSQDCEVSPLAVVGRTGAVATGEFSDVTRFPAGRTCELIDLGGLPSGLAVEDQIVLYPAAPTSCDDDWEVWLWIDDERRIATVNTLVPEK